MDSNTPKSNTPHMTPNGDEYAARLTAAEATVAQLRAENEQLRSARVSSPGEIPGGVVTSPTALHQLTTLRSWPVVVSP